jgi:isoquinoline 1-oxidoreductase subunit beta
MGTNAVPLAEAQVQGSELMGLSMCLRGAAITLKEGVVEQSNFGDFVVLRITDMPQIAVHIVPCAEPPPAWASPVCHRWHPRSPTPSRA